jgi:hypothetical protein
MFLCRESWSFLKNLFHDCVWQLSAKPNHTQLCYKYPHMCQPAMLLLLSLSLLALGIAYLVQ